MGLCVGRVAAVAFSATALASAGCGGGHARTVTSAPPRQHVAGSLPDMCDLRAVERASRDPGRSPSDRRFLRAVARDLRAAARDDEFSSGCTSIQIPVRK
jgi:hypothetical protein